jgi:galactokinase
LDQFDEESNHLVPEAARAIATRDYARLGAVAERSHALAIEKLGNQLPETIDLQLSARTLGAHAASAFGAGFGGSVWALVPTASAESFAQEWEREYRSRYAEAGRTSRFFASRPGGPAHSW